MVKAATLALSSVCIGAAIALYHRYRAVVAALQDKLQEATSRRNRLALSLMDVRNRSMHTEESTSAGRSFAPRASDVFVVTYPKCGTTWVTQIVHALRTGASMDFGEITEVCPWDIMACICEQDLDADHVASPRVFKSHEAWCSVAKGGRYIYVARNPLDAFYSFFKFLPSFCGLEQGDLDEQTFAAAIFAGTSHSGQIWNHFLGWWEQRHREDVLWVFFEDLVADLPNEVKRIARFAGIDATPELIDAVVGVSSFESMSSAANKFHYDDHFIRSFIYPRMGIASDAQQEIIKVRTGGGKVGSRKSIPHSLRQRLDDKWAAVLAKPTGCAGYDAFRERFKCERRY